MLPFCLVHNWVGSPVRRSIVEKLHFHSITAWNLCSGFFLFVALCIRGHTYGLTFTILPLPHLRILWLTMPTHAKIVFPAPPPTFNSLTSTQRAQLLRSTKKLERLLGTAPRLLDENLEPAGAFPSIAQEYFELTIY